MRDDDAVRLVLGEQCVDARRQRQPEPVTHVLAADLRDLLTGEIGQAAEKARNRKLSLDDMQGGSITISNLGSLGGGAFTPIVNWPEVAILGVARARTEPVYIDGEFVARFLMPLTLSYDHRVIDGADGVRILRWIVEAIEQPALIWLDN